MIYQFIKDSRLGIQIPVLYEDWESIDKQTQEMILMEWETIRGRIPDRIKKLEECINQKLEAMGSEENFETSCQLNNDISELASIINDLWIWYRSNQSVSHKELP